VKWLRNDKLKRIWKEAIIFWSMYRPGTYPKGLKNIEMSAKPVPQPRLETNSSRIQDCSVNTKPTCSVFYGMSEFSKANVYCMHRLLQLVQTPHFPHRLYLRASHDWLWQQTATISVHCIKRLFPLLDRQLFILGKNLIFKCKKIDCYALNPKNTAETVLKLRQRKLRIL
jgi:hypothetical protein